MRGALFLVLLLSLAAPAAAQRTPLGIFSEWGAFSEEGRCFAVGKPHRALKPRGWKPYATVSFGGGVRGQVYFRLSREKRPGSAVLLRIDRRTFQLIGGGANAWAPDTAADLSILAAMRQGVAMVVETRSTSGGRVRDHYRLRGAPTAIDAAAIACVQR
jgi:hypothetical protein